MKSVPAYIETGDGPDAMLFLHGMGGDKHSWDGQLAHFGQNGRRAIAWDAPGYGDTPAIDDFSWPNLAAAVLALIDELRIDKVILIGHSMGGMIAQEFAYWYPARLRALVLSGTSPAFGRPDGEFQRAFVAARLAPLDAGRTMDELAPMAIRELVGDDPDPAGVIAATACMTAVQPDTYRRATNTIVTFDRRAALASIAVPTLVVAGSRDTNAPSAMMQRMAAKIPGARYIELPGAGHLANFEQPAAFNAALDVFVATLEFSNGNPR